MDVVSLGPLRVGSLAWRLRSGAWALTVVCKATFKLRPIESILAEVQETLNEDDNHWDDDPSRSIYSPSDFAPFKARADVLLVGNAIAPRNEPVRSLVARLQVGDVDRTPDRREGSVAQVIDKAVEVCCDRAWTRDGELIEGVPFARMPLRYERAAGGLGTNNPVGMWHEGPPDPYGNVAIPNLQPPGLTLGSRMDVIPPIGLGPISPAWPERQGRLGANAGAWPAPEWTEQPLPEGIDPRYFNAAPPDQQLEEIRPDERLILEKLHPEHARLVTALPGIVPIATIARIGMRPEPLEMRADTLWIDTNRGVCTVTWRAQIQLAMRNEPGVVTISLDPTAAGDVAGVVLLPHKEGEAAARPLDPAQKPVEIIKLLWFEPKSLPAIRKHEPWRATLAEIHRGLDEEEPARGRREVSAILARGEATAAEGIQQALSEAVDESGIFEPPLCLLSGDLELPLDDLEGATNAEAQTERRLLEERRYQRRTLYGATWIRSLFHLRGADAPLPAYLPESLAKELPMFRRFRARVVGEIDLQEDQFENHPNAVRVVALARVTDR